jgi:ribose 5-phosphate isomerase B
MLKTNMPTFIAANKVKGVRCGLGFEPDQVHAARKDDNINCLTLAADNVTEDEALLLVDKFLNTEFVETDRYVRRVQKIARYEREVFEQHKRAHGKGM